MDSNIITWYFSVCQCAKSPKPARRLTVGFSRPRSCTRPKFLVTWVVAGARWRGWFDVDFPISTAGTPSTLELIIYFFSTPCALTYSICFFFCVCVCNILIDVKLLSFSSFCPLPFLNLVAGGQSHVCSWLPNEEGCIHDWYDSGTLESRTCYFNFDWHGTRPSLEPHSCIFTSRLSQSGIKFGHLRLVQLHQNLPQYFRRNHVADSIFDFLDYFAEPCRRCIWGIPSKPRRQFIFDDDLGHGNHSGELLLFVGCIVNFVVSYLICMFQDSVPAGSYNDPFLSSVIPMVTPTWCHRANWGNPF